MTDDPRTADMPWVGHEDHEWREVPPCVYCVPCNMRLYQGSLPEWKDPELAARRAVCEHLEHEMYDDGDGILREMGEGFYWVCPARGWFVGRPLAKPALLHPDACEVCGGTGKLRVLL